MTVAPPGSRRSSSSLEVSESEVPSSGVPSSEVPPGGDRVEVWARAVEAGVLARAARLDPDAPWRGSATDEELRTLEQLGLRARQELVAANVGLVRTMVSSFARPGEGAADLVQEGCVGLMLAVERFDHRRGVRFSTYATYWVRAHLAAATARQAGAVSLPVGRADQLRVAHGIESRLAQELGRLPTAGEVGLVLGRGARWTADLLGQRSARSVDELDDRSLHRLRVVTEADAGAEHDEQVWVRRLLATLNGFERRVLELRSGFGGRPPASRPEVARELGVPVGRVRRAEARALERLRERCPLGAREEAS